MPDIDLGPRLDEFVRAQVESGRFPTASDIVRAALLLLEDQDKLRADVVRKVNEACDDPRPRVPARDVSGRVMRNRCGPNSVAVSVRFSVAAQDDLFDPYRFTAVTADCPERGTRRDDLRPGLRVAGFERRAAILFQVDRDGVEINRILYEGRDLRVLAIAPQD